MVLGSIYSLIKAWRKGGLERVRYDLKGSGNAWSYLLSFVLTAYFIIGSVSVAPVIVDWAKNYDLASNTSPLGEWLIRHGTMYAWFIATILVTMWIVNKLWKPFKYNEKEKEWHKEEQIKFRDKLPQFLRRFVKIDENKTGAK
jgi:uncharacterized membrane protein